MKLRDVIDRIMPMLEDARWAENALDCEDNQFTRRAYIRNVFAMIEGCVWALKQLVLDAPTKTGNPKKLPLADYSLISETTYELKSNGQIRTQPKFLKLPENVRFTFGLLEKYFQAKADLGVGGKSWADFVKVQEIRNRITHPKSSAQFTVSDEEIEMCKNVCSWFNSLIANFIETLVASQQDKVA
jgi:hypothetical protein